MICPYCKEELYQPEKDRLITTDPKYPEGVLVDVYECEQDDKVFVVLAGNHLSYDAFGNTYDLRTGTTLREEEAPIREILLKNKPLDGTSSYRINEGVFRVIGKEGGENS